MVVGRVQPFQLADNIAATNNVQAQAGEDGGGRKWCRPRKPPLPADSAPTKSTNHQQTVDVRLTYFCLS
jgi:hypothetical protein